MPTTKLTSLVCVMLTAAMLWSSLGVGLNATPLESSSDIITSDDAAADATAIPDVPSSNTETPYQNKVNFNGGSDRTTTADGGWNYEPNVAPWGNWSFREAHNVPETGLTGEGVRVAVADTGIDFGAQNLAGKYMVDNKTYTVTNHTLTSSTVSGQNNVSLPNTNIVAGSLEIRVNGTITTSYTANLVRGEVNFTSALPPTSSVICSYQHQPYYGWPVAFDALGLPEYLLAKEARTGGGGVANTTLNGTGPFDIDHTIKVDGQSDFTITESVCTDDPGDVKVNGTDSGEGFDFDLTELWGTRDPTYWYAGIQTRNAAMNRTFGFAFDFDGAASGSTTDPKGNLLDFEASHSSAIEQVAFEPNTGLVASCAGSGDANAITKSYDQNSVKIWDQSGNLLRSLPNEQYPVTSVIWSPNGQFLAYQTSRDVVVFETTSWTEVKRITQSTSGPNIREAMAFSNNGTMLVAGALNSNNIQVLNLQNMSRTAKPVTNNIVQTVAYSPDGTMIALGLAGGVIQILDSTTYDEVMSFIAPGFVGPDTTSIETLAWSPNNQQIATGRSAVGQIDIWNLTQGNNRMYWGGEDNTIDNINLTNKLKPVKLIMRGVPNEGGAGSYLLGTNTVGSSLQMSPTMPNGGNYWWGIRVWKRSAAGVESELTGGIPVAQVNRTVDSVGNQKGTWTPPTTALNPTDSIVVRVYQGSSSPPLTLVANFTSGQLNSTQLNNTMWNITYSTRMSAAQGAIQTRMIGHGPTSTVNTIKWTATKITSGADDGKIISWNPVTFTPTGSSDSRYNSPVLSFARNDMTGDMFVGTKDCTVRKYNSAWNPIYTKFASQKPDIVVYVRYEREYYEPVTKKLSEPDRIEVPEVYKWNTGTSSWMETNMTNIFGKAFYKGMMSGEWTVKGFLEIALPRNFTAWPNQNNVYITSFTCSGERVNGVDVVSRPQDTVPSDCNVPSAPPSFVNWAGTRKTTLSAWGNIYIPKTTIITKNTTNNGIPSVTGKYHFGYHPSAALTKMFGLVPIVVTESTTEGVWDRVYVDMNRDYIIDSLDPYVDKNNPVLTIDIWNISTGSNVPGPDGIPDLSGGMVYFIGDGKTMMPYSERMSEVLVLSGDQLTPFGTDNPMPIPKNGEIVAFFGEFDIDADGIMRTHGTQTASAIAGEGLNKGQFGFVEGVSPDVKFLPISNAQYNLDYALYFAVEGYDGKTNTGDEAQIVSIGQYSTGYGNGFDETTYLVESLVNSTQSNVVFVSPAGNDGSGYGTIAAPCGMNTLVVGFAEDNTFISGGGDTQHFGGVSELSSRGPTAAGLAKPDVIAIGLGEVDMPLGASGSPGSSYGGKSQTTLWKGSDLAAAVTTGVTALMFEAYEKKNHGSYPTTQMAMDMIRSSAKDLGYDALTQGSGFVDALAAVRMAQRNSGLIVSAPKTSFGNTFGSEYGSFINVLGPGENDTIPINVQSTSIGTENPVYEVEYMQRINVSKRCQLVTSDGYKADISNMFPANAEVVKVTAQTQYSWMAGTDYKTFLSMNGYFYLRLWDWVDAPPGDPLHHNIDVNEISYLTGVDYGKVNSLTCTISNLQSELAGKLVIDLAPDADNELPTRYWNITVESFATVPWSWSSLSKATSTIATNSEDNVSIEVDVPSNAQSGTYEAAFVSSYGPTPVNWVDNIQPASRDEEEYLNTTLYTTYWDDGAMGNYWNDWTAPDANTDGIVDNPYNFLTTGKADLYPLVNPVNTFAYSSSIVSSLPISISSNSDFATYATRGDGTAGNPWIIENLDIDGSAYAVPGISITDTTDSFTVRGCYIHDAQNMEEGVYLSNVKNGVFENNNISLNTYDGLSFISGCSNIIVNNNTIYMNSQFGVSVVSSDHIYFSENTISYSIGTIGVYQNGCNNITIAGNSIHNNNFGSGSYGIYLENGVETHILGNKLNSDDMGLVLDGVVYSEIVYNEFNLTPAGSMYITASCAINVIHHNDILDLTTNAYDDGTNTWDDGAEGNYWNGPVGAPYAIGGGAGNQDNFPLATAASKLINLISHAPISIIGDAEFTLANGVTGGSGTALDPFIIQNWEINSTAASCGILIQNTTAYFIVMNCKIYGNVTGTGIMLSNTSNGVIRSNELYGLGTGAFALDNAIFALSYNDVHDTVTGIYIKNSNNGTVTYNSVHENVNGIRIDSSQTCIVMANNASNNTNKGIFIQTSIDIETRHNTVAGNINDGIRVQQSSECILANNTLDTNGYGIHLDNATGFNDIYHNNLIDNTAQAYDDFIGDTLPFSSFEIFSDFGIPANFYSIYDVKDCTVTVYGILGLKVLIKGTDYTINNDTGVVTVLISPSAQSGGAIVSIKAVLTYEENAPTRITLPNQRLTPSTANIKVVVMKIDGSSYIVPAGNYTLYKKVGIIEFTVPFEIQRGVTIFANYTYYNRTGIVPLVLNVLAAETAAIEFGDMTADEAALGIPIMPVWGVRPGQGTSLESGDRRYFYVRIPNQGMFSITELANFYLYTELNWDLYQTDINIVVYGKGSTAMYPKAAPYIMTKLGGSEERVDFSPLTATGQNKDILVTPFNNEILTICISAKNFFGSDEAITKFEGKSGWIKLSDNNPKAWTNNMVGQASVSFQSSVDLPSGIFASVVGPAQGTKTVEEIEQDDLSLYDLSTMEGWLTMNAVAGFTKVVSVKNALSWDVHIIGHPECVDLDLAVFYDGLNGQPKDGVAQWREIITRNDMNFDAYKSNYGTGLYAYCADADADEAIKFINPPDGDYIIKVLGFTVTSVPGYFDLDVKSIFAGVEGYKLTQKETQYADEDPLSGNYLNTENVSSYDVRTFNVLWTFPEETLDGVYAGIFMFGIPESQKLITISMDIILDREAPTISPMFTGPNSVVSNKMPTVSAKIEDISRGEIDPVGTRVYFDGRDITDLAAISVTQTSNSALQLGYWTGDVIFKSLSPLSEGGHFISIEAKDLTGNVVTSSWGFTVDTIKPEMSLSNPLDEIYTSTRNYQLRGTTEPNSAVSFIGVQGVVNQRIDNSFVLDLDLEEGANLIGIRSTDLAGNTYETQKTIILDTDAPEFKRVVALDGSITNKRMTGIYGEMTEAGTLELNGAQVSVNSDGTFRYDAIMLVEGQNRQALKFTDRAGNIAYSFMNITLDSIAPMLQLADIDRTVNSEWLNITGKTEGSIASLTINGKLVDVAANGNFQNNIRLSPGINTIVIESKDRAGNSAQEVMTVVYAADAGTNFGAIGLMVVLLILGLILGLFLAPIILGGKKEETPGEIEPPIEESVTEVDATPETEDMEAVSEESVPENIDETTPETEELEPIPAEESKTVEPTEEVQPEPAAEDPRIAKLRDAYESGKISKELYEKNLARFKGE
jgi:parallel beta-helix repeat protein